MTAGKQSRNIVYSSAVVTMNSNKNAFSSKRSSIGKLCQIDTNCTQPKRNKSKTKQKQNNLGVNKRDFELLLDSISNFNTRLQAPTEIMENCKVLYLENSVLHQAISAYESQVSSEVIDKIHSYLGMIQPEFSKREQRLLQMSEYWKDKTKILIEKYTDIIKHLKETVTKERKENIQN